VAHRLSITSSFVYKVIARYNQVVYNANYAKYCDRARQAAVGLTQLAELEVQCSTSPCVTVRGFGTRDFLTIWAGEQSKGMHMQLVHLTNHKLKASAILGSSVKVETWIEAADPSTGLIRWRQEVTDADSGAMLSTAQTLTRFVSKDGSKLPVDKSTLAVKAIEARGLGHWGDSGRSQLLHKGKTCSLLSAKLDFRSGQDGNSHHAEFRVFSGVPMEAGYEKIAAIAQGTLHRIIVISDEGLKGLGTWYP
jgi:acyl-CoA thioesterase FadM